MVPLTPSQNKNHQNFPETRYFSSVNMNYYHFLIEQQYSPGVLVAGVLLELLCETTTAVFWFLGCPTGGFLSLQAAGGFCLFDGFTSTRRNKNTIKWITISKYLNILWLRNTSKRITSISNLNVKSWGGPYQIMYIDTHSCTCPHVSLELTFSPVPLKYG